MTNEHTERTPAPLRGYRVLSDEEKALVDRIKLCEDEVGKLWAQVYRAGHTTLAHQYALAAEVNLRQGFMELVRSVTRPRDPYRDNLSIQEADRG